MTQWGSEVPHVFCSQDPARMTMEWNKLLAPDESTLEIIFRGSTTYLILFFLFRFFRNRTSGQKGLSDLLLVVLLADAVQNAMAGEYKSITSGIVLAFTIAFWAWFLNWVRYRVPWTRRFLRSELEIVIRDGLPIRRGLRRELMTLDDLHDELRRQDIHDISTVRLAMVEEDGSLTTII